MTCFLCFLWSGFSVFILSSFAIVWRVTDAWWSNGLTCHPFSSPLTPFFLIRRRELFPTASDSRLFYLLPSKGKKWEDKVWTLAWDPIRIDASFRMTLILHKTHSHTLLSPPLIYFLLSSLILRLCDCKQFNSDAHFLPSPLSCIPISASWAQAVQSPCLLYTYTHRLTDTYSGVKKYACLTDTVYHFPSAGVSLSPGLKIT